jgi:hypothetical protein
MTKSFWRSPEMEANANEGSAARATRNGFVAYKSTATFASESLTGVTFTVRRVSLGMRMELMRKIREISRRIEFLSAGDELQERIEANLLANEIDAAYLRWGLVDVGGLEVDGEAATADVLIEKGPDALTSEIARAIKAECGLNEEERKNS